MITKLGNFFILSPDCYLNKFNNYQLRSVMKANYIIYIYLHQILRNK